MPPARTVLISLSTLFYCLKTENYIRRRGSGIAAAIFFGCLAVLNVAPAHEGPEHDIEELTERIAKEGDSADLRVQRAIEYKVLGKLAEAAKDLERALQFDPRMALAQRELGRTYFALGKTNEALETISRGLKNASEKSDHAALLMARAEVLGARKEYQKALDDADEAIREHPENAEWYLFRGQLHRSLKLKKERVRGLAAGFKETGSGVLEGEWLEALIDNGEHAAALQRIETELRASRLKSTWWIRRAKVRLASGEKEGAKSDLELAVAELNRRITANTQDGLLLADRGMAFELLGKKEEAHKDYDQAREKGLTEEWLRERLRSLKDTNDPMGDREKAKDKQN